MRIVAYVLAAPGGAECSAVGAGGGERERENQPARREAAVDCSTVARPEAGAADKLVEAVVAATATAKLLNVVLVVVLVVASLEASVVGAVEGERACPRTSFRRLCTSPRGLRHTKLWGPRERSRFEARRGSFPSLKSLPSQRRRRRTLRRPLSTERAQLRMILVPLSLFEGVQCRFVVSATRSKMDVVCRHR